MTQLIVYGSLLNPDSASSGLNREVTLSDYSDIEIRGYELAFDLLEQVLIDNNNIDVCFLNLRKKEGSSIRVKYLAVTQPELELLHAREKNYDLVDLSQASTRETPEKVFAFIGQPRHTLAPTAQPAILQNYIDKVRKGARLFPPEFAAQFEINLDDSTRHGKIVEGAYQFISNQQNRLAGYEDVKD